MMCSITLLSGRLGNWVIWLARTICVYTDSSVNMLPCEKVKQSVRFCFLAKVKIAVFLLVITVSGFSWVKGMVL